MPIAPWVYWDKQPEFGNLWELLDMVEAQRLDYIHNKSMSKRQALLNARKPDKKAEISKQDLDRLYTTMNMSIREVSLAIGRCDTYVWSRLVKYGIKRRRQGGRRG
jgi:hypothetical protein